MCKFYRQKLLNKKPRNGSDFTVTISQIILIKGREQEQKKAKVSYEY